MGAVEEVPGALLLERMRTAVERVSKLPASLPAPQISVTTKSIIGTWEAVSANQARAIIRALPGHWETAEGLSYLYRVSPEDPASWFVHLARRSPMPPPAVIDPLTLLAEVES